MDVAHVLRMAGGLGRTSYASNSLLQVLSHRSSCFSFDTHIQIQEKAIAKAKPLVEQAVADLYSSIVPKSMAVADLGCSSGPNALIVAAEIMDAIRETSRQLGCPAPETQYFLNDLPGNDFNTLFGYLASFQGKLKEEEGPSTMVPFYFSAVAGSFYRRLFPKDSIHFVHSSYCLHYLSQVPQGVESEAGDQLNKRNIYISQTSPPAVYKSYLEQFQKDFTLFLRLRSEEIISGGRMILVFLGRRNADTFHEESSSLLKLMADALTQMAIEGLIEEAKVDSFNLPFYAPSVEEVKAMIYGEGSFDVIHCDVFELNWDPTDDLLDDFVAEKSKSGENVAKSIRAVFESMLIDRFGGAIIDDLFSRYAENVATHLSKKKTKYINLRISLKKKATRKI